MNPAFLRKVNNIHVVADKVLIKPLEDSEKTSSGLFLPPGVQEKEKIQSGYVLKTGPGYPIGANVDEEPWKENKEQVKYITLQAKNGDLAIFTRKDAFEIEIEDEKLLIVPHQAILMFIRDDFSEFSS
ncbi:MAG: co-chaperone GroES family protein [Ignavibacteria bacterium]|nr:co-chaperone GroES family protein [Ignavibacteria bacterium]